MQGSSPWFVIAALSVGAAGALFDLRARRVPNWLTLPALALSPALHALAAHDEHLQGAFGLPGPALEALLSLVGIVAAGIVPFAMAKAGWMGGGDVKLLAAIGGLLSARLGVESQLLALVAAGYFGLARLAFRGQLLATLRRVLMAAASPVLPSARREAAPPALFETLPFAPFVFLGTLAAVLLQPRAL